MACLQQHYSDTASSSFANLHKNSFLVSGVNGRPIIVTSPSEELEEAAIGLSQSMFYSGHSDPSIVEVTGKESISVTAGLRRSRVHTIPGADRVVIVAGLPEYIENSTVFQFSSTQKGEIENLTKAIDALSPELHDRLDQNALDRLELFKGYKDGWNNGSGKKLSRGSIACLEFFLRTRAEKIDTGSIFLTPNGNLELFWTDVNGCDVELEFFPDKISSYIESYQVEQDYKLSEIEALIDKL